MGKSQPTPAVAERLFHLTGTTLICAVGDHEGRIVTAIRHGSLEVKRKVLADGKAAAYRGHRKTRDPVSALAMDSEPVVTSGIRLYPISISTPLAAF